MRRLTAARMTIWHPLTRICEYTVDELDALGNALIEFRKSSSLLRKLSLSGNDAHDLIAESRRRRDAAERRLYELTSRGATFEISALVSALTAEAKAKTNSALIPNLEDGEPFTRLSHHYNFEEAGAKVTAPPIVVSFDIKRSYIDAYGYRNGRKLAGVGRSRVTEYVNWASGVGYLRIGEIEHELAATTGIARVKLVLIDGAGGDFKMDPPKHGKPLSIDVIDVQIDESL